jgi:hypothetical protein
LLAVILLALAWALLLSLGTVLLLKLLVRTKIIP